jgi:ketosteroid isomerase-like protein
MRRILKEKAVLALTNATLAELEKFRGQAAVEEQNRALVRRIFDELNRRNDGVYQELYAPEYGWHFPSNNPKAQNREEEAGFVNLLWAGFPDIRWDVKDMIARDDTIVARFVARGTHKGEYQGLLPTGNTFEVGCVWTGRIKNGKVVEAREEADVLGWMQQLGMELKPKQPQKK